ncbi:MAG: hypothetical protein HOP19_00220 [Acidobacteria bacterium]|nr:hypothetical protein [Acidobacteriota bacterium]
MIRFRQTLFALTFAGATLCASACREAAPSNSTANATASPAAAAGDAGAAAASSPVVLASPIDPTKPIPMPSGAAGAMPNSLNAIPERLRRPLTLEEINALPPETRDMILKAQGRLPAKGAATPTKK